MNPHVAFIPHIKFQLDSTNGSEGDVDNVKRSCTLPNAHKNEHTAFKLTSQISITVQFICYSVRSDNLKGLYEGLDGV